MSIVMKQKKKYKGIFFDMGGTLVFPNPIRMADFLEKKVQPSPLPEQLLEAIHFATVELDRSLEKDGKIYGDWWTAYFEGVRKYLFPNISPLEKNWVSFLETLRNEHEKRNLWDYWVPNVEVLLAHFFEKGIYLGIISNSDGRVQNQLDSIGLSKFFGFVLDSHIVKCEKPQPEIFLMALEKSGLCSSDVIYVGDFVNIDFVGARKVGMDAVIIDPLGTRRSWGVPTICALSELPNYLGY